MLLVVGFGWLWKMLEWVGDQLMGPAHKGNVNGDDTHAMINGYSNLSRGYKYLINSLGKRIEHLEKQNENLGRQIEENAKDIIDCNEHRTELEKRLCDLESKAIRDEGYAHDNVHFIRNYLHALEFDLQNAGLTPEARKSVMDSQQARYESPKN